MTTGFKKLGKYDVLDVIGRGGMGVIYKGVDPGIGRVVAIKMMTGAFVENPELLQRFYREAQSAGKLQHPNIVTIYDLGVQDGNPYLVMEFLEGEPLEAVIRAHRPILLEEKLNIVTQICSGVGYAHQRHIVHRDIKPANVMLLKDGGVKIVDFGIARIGDEGMTRPGQIMGSIQYMSPEQINAGNVDTRSDIFSIGVLFYQLLTSALPFEGKDTGDTLLKIIHEPPPPLSHYLKSYPSELDEIVKRVLAKDREERYQAAEDLAFDLVHVQEQLKRERTTEYLEEAETARSEGQLNRAKEQLLQVLKIDRQNVRANTLLREVQQEIQKQQRSEQARELQAEAEKALAQGELAGALNYLNQAVELDKGNSEILVLRDSVRQNKERTDKLRDLVQKAEMAQDAGDLDEAKRAVDEALVIDGRSTEVRSLQGIISREIAERDKQLRVQKCMVEARKQISSRHFTAALQVLQQAQTVDPAVPGIQELINLASSGQQQEKRRKDLDRLTGEIEDALNRDDYATACAKAQEGLSIYPDDRGLSKLKAVADKQREASEKRKYIESKISAARKLLEQHKASEALPYLKEALEKYPTEFGLQSMFALVTESVEREKEEQKKSDSTQKAKEAIRRKAYDEAISILENARRETGSTDFDDLLQFAQDEAASYAKRKRVDAVAEQAHRLNSEERYDEAIQLLEDALREIPDEELEIILSDIRRRVEEFSRGVEEAVTNANRLLKQERFAEAVKFLEGQAPQYGKAPYFAAILEKARHKQQQAQALSVAMEEVNAALSRSDLDRAQQLWQQYSQECADNEDFQALAKEIEAKRREVANSTLEMAVRDARMLLLVRSYDSALSVLETAAALAAAADADLRARFSTLLEAARVGAANQHHEKEVQKARQEGRTPEAPKEDLPSMGSLETLDLGDATQLADPGHLEDLLGEVTIIANHYRDDNKVRVAIDNLKQELSSKLSALREAELAQERGGFAEISPESQRPAGTTMWDGGGAGAGPRALNFDPISAEFVPEARARLEPPVQEAATSVLTPPFGLTDVPESLTSMTPTEQASAVESPVEVEKPVETPRAIQPEIVPVEQPRAPKVAPEPQIPPRIEIPAEVSAPQVPDASDLEDALLKRLEEEDRLAAAQEAATPVAAPPPPAPAVTPPPKTPRPTPPPRAKTPAKIPTVRPTPAPPKRPTPPVPAAAPDAFRQKLPLLAGAAVVLLIVIGLVVHFRSKPVQPASVPVTTTAPVQPEVNPIEAQQKAAIDAADKLEAADDLDGARKKLQEVTGLKGPLDSTVQSRLAGIDAAMKDKGLRVLRRNEEQLWQKATKEVDAGKFDVAKNDLRKILDLGEGSQRKADAQNYLDQVIPNRQKEQQLFAQAQLASRDTRSAGLQHASDLLDQVIALNGPRKADAQALRGTVNSKIEGLAKGQRDRQIALLENDVNKHIRLGQFSEARQNLDDLKKLGADTGPLAARIDDAEKNQRAQAEAETTQRTQAEAQKAQRAKDDAAFQLAVQHSKEAINSNDKGRMQAALAELQSISQGGGPHAGEAGTYSSEINKKLALLEAPPPVSASTPAKTTSPSAGDTAAVKGVLQRYAEAFETRDVVALQQIWPTLGKRYAGYKKAFDSASSIRLRVEPGEVTIAPDGSSATVEATVAQDYTPKGQKTLSNQARSVFQFSKSNGSWVIRDVQ